MQDNFTQELTFGKEIAFKAGEIMLRFFDADQEEQQKADNTPVTIADKMINSMVIEEIKKNFPEDIIVGEEESTGD